MRPGVYLHIGLTLVLCTHGPPPSFLLQTGLTVFSRIELTSELQIIWWKYAGVPTSWLDLRSTPPPCKLAYQPHPRTFPPF